MLTFGLALFDNGRTEDTTSPPERRPQSTDGGVTWRNTHVMADRRILCVVPDPVDSSVIYAATRSAFFKTTDDGTTWERKMEGIPTWFIRGL